MNNLRSVVWVLWETYWVPCIMLFTAVLGVAVTVLFKHLQLSSDEHKTLLRREEDEDAATENQHGETANPEKKLKIPRPQDTYHWSVDNGFHRFRPKLTSKPNALRSLEESMNGDRKQAAPHPYQFELDAFQPNSESLKPVIPKQALSMERTPFSYIDSPKCFREALVELGNANELAIDLEHHSYRTYLGITCLMQISSRVKDYVIDTIALRDIVSELSGIFSNPRIQKVFHGADWDILWLQRDFGLYVVNMFDTGQAARALELPRLSLEFLFHHYLDRNIDKTHKLSDWRIRPLPKDMLTYARTDTHDLLYICDRIRNDLIAKDPSLLDAVYAQSKIRCLQRYEKPVLNFGSFAWMEWEKLNDRQRFALKKILEWRDKTARKLDESSGYVLPTQHCVDIAKSLPRDAKQLKKAVKYMPIVLKQKMKEVMRILWDAHAFTSEVGLPITFFE